MIDVIGTLTTIAFILGLWKLWDLVNMYNVYKANLNKKIEDNLDKDIKTYLAELK